MNAIGPIPIRMTPHFDEGPDVSEIAKRAEIALGLTRYARGAARQADWERNHMTRSQNEFETPHKGSVRRCRFLSSDERPPDLHDLRGEGDHL